MCYPPIGASSYYLPANNYYNYYPYGYNNIWNTLFPFGLPGFDGAQNWIYQSVG